MQSTPSDACEICLQPLACMPAAEGRSRLAPRRVALIDNREWRRLRRANLQPLPRTENRRTETLASASSWMCDLAREQ
ncbi:hypothetical protein MRX96_038660 [Rhipicephalus microplus]